MIFGKCDKDGIQLDRWKIIFFSIAFILLVGTAISLPHPIDDIIEYLTKYAPYVLLCCSFFLSWMDIRKLEKAAKEQKLNNKNIFKGYYFYPAVYILVINFMLFISGLYRSPKLGASNWHEFIMTNFVFLGSFSGIHLFFLSFLLFKLLWSIFKSQQRPYFVFTMVTAILWFFIGGFFLINR